MADNIISRVSVRKPGASPAGTSGSGSGGSGAGSSSSGSGGGDGGGSSSSSSSSNGGGSSNNIGSGGLDVFESYDGAGERDSFIGAGGAEVFYVGGVPLPRGVKVVLVAVIKAGVTAYVAGEAGNFRRVKVAINIIFDQNHVVLLG